MALEVPRAFATRKAAQESTPATAACGSAIDGGPRLFLLHVGGHARGHARGHATDRVSFEPCRKALWCTEVCARGGGCWGCA
jgi:hypothetical protein